MKKVKIKELITESFIDKTWGAVAKVRLQELRSGGVIAVPSEEVFKKIAARAEIARIRSKQSKR